jgi:hypothetical protein
MDFVFISSEARRATHDTPSGYHDIKHRDVSAFHDVNGTGQAQ